MESKTRCGYVAILGRPNVGKSTLLNQILNQKISITSKKPQTTRHRILGIKTVENVQTIYVDTPGIHDFNKNLLNRTMNRVAMSAVSDVDVIIFLMDANSLTENDEKILNQIKDTKTPIILVLNKVDLIKDKKQLLPIMESWHQKFPNMEMVPLSALKRDNIVVLEACISKLLPCNPFFYDKEQVTDRDQRFIIAEIIREKIMRVTGKEVPYATAVCVESMEVKKTVLHIDVIIWVEREGQKPIIISKNGERLKKIGRQARLELEKILKQKIFLSLWVKVKSGWSNNQGNLNQLGIE